MKERLLSRKNLVNLKEIKLGVFKRALEGGGKLRHTFNRSLSTPVSSRYML